MVGRVSIIMVRLDYHEYLYYVQFMLNVLSI